MDSDEWKYTVVGCSHARITGNFKLESEELVIASGYISDRNWWVVTTRRIASLHNSKYSELDPRNGIKSRFGHFKSTANGGLETAEISTNKGDQSLQFVFETGKASMAPIYACIFWSRAVGFHYPKKSA